MRTRNRWVNLRLLLPAFPLDQVESCLWFTCEPVGRLCVDPLRAVLARRAVLRWILINTGERGGGQELVAHAKALLKRTANELPAEASADAFCSFTFDDARGCGGGASRETGAGERPPHSPGCRETPGPFAGYEATSRFGIGLPRRPYPYGVALFPEPFRRLVHYTGRPKPEAAR